MSHTAQAPLASPAAIEQYITYCRRNITKLEPRKDLEYVVARWFRKKLRWDENDNGSAVIHCFFEPFFAVTLHNASSDEAKSDPDYISEFTDECCLFNTVNEWRQYFAKRSAKFMRGATDFAIRLVVNPRLDANIRGPLVIDPEETLEEAPEEAPEEELEATQPIEID